MTSLTDPTNVSGCLIKLPPPGRPALGPGGATAPDTREPASPGRRRWSVRRRPDPPRRRVRSRLGRTGLGRPAGCREVVLLAGAACRRGSPGEPPRPVHRGLCASGRELLRPSRPTRSSRPRHGRLLRAPAAEAARRGHRARCAVTGEVLGLEVARAVFSTTMAARASRSGSAATIAGVRHAPRRPPPHSRRARPWSMPRTHRRAGARPIPLNRLAGERWLAHLCDDSHPPAGVAVAVRRHLVPPERQRPPAGLRSVKADADGAPVVLGCSVGIDLEFCAPGGRRPLDVDPSARLVLAVPARMRTRSRGRGRLLAQPAEISRSRVTGAVERSPARRGPGAVLIGVRGPTTLGSMDERLDELEREFSTSSAPGRSCWSRTNSYTDVARRYKELDAVVTCGRPCGAPATISPRARCTRRPTPRP
jgi:hypothetical protein